MHVVVSRLSCNSHVHGLRTQPASQDLCAFMATTHTQFAKNARNAAMLMHYYQFMQRAVQPRCLQ